MVRSSEEARRDKAGNRLFRCVDCGGWKRVEGSVSPIEGRCRPCHRAATGRPAREPGPRPENAGERIAEEDLAARLGAARRLKAARCGRIVREGEIEAALEGASHGG